MQKKPCKYIKKATGRGYLGRTRFTDSPQISPCSCLLNIFKGVFLHSIFIFQMVQIFLFMHKICVLTHKNVLQCLKEVHLIHNGTWPTAYGCMSLLEALFHTRQEIGAKRAIRKHQIMGYHPKYLGHLVVTASHTLPSQLLPSVLLPYCPTGKFVRLVFYKASECE